MADNINYIILKYDFTIISEVKLTKNIIKLLAPITSKIIIAISILILLSSCGADRMLMKADYDNGFYGDESLKTDEIKVVKVTDNRFKSKAEKASKPKPKKKSHRGLRRKKKKINIQDSAVFAGYAYTGAFNKKVPFILDVPITEFVENSINKMISNSNAGDSFIPITVDIDTFYVYEKIGMISERGIFKCALRFHYQATPDSFKIIKTYSLQEVNAGVDVTNSLENLIYKGMHECTEQFIKHHRKGKYDVVSSGIATKSMSGGGDSKIPVIVEENAYGEKQQESDSRGVIGGTYYSGTKIKSGVGIYYNSMFYRKDKQFVHGIGYVFSYYDVENTEAGIRGAFTGLSIRYNPRYYFFKSREWLYLAGGVRLSFGTEKIGNNTNFFIGPTFEEALGIKIGPLSIEGGLFQLRHFGSQILPNDTGFIISAGINL